MFLTLITLSSNFLAISRVMKILKVLVPLFEGAAAPGRRNNHITESNNDSNSEYESLSHELDDKDIEEVFIAHKKKDKVINLGDHIKLRKKNVIGGKFKCDHRGCHPVDYDYEADASL